MLYALILFLLQQPSYFITVWWTPDHSEYTKKFTSYELRVNDRPWFKIPLTVPQLEYSWTSSFAPGEYTVYLRACADTVCQPEEDSRSIRFEVLNAPTRLRITP